LALLTGSAAAEVVRGVVYTPPYWPQALEADIHLPREPGPRPAVLLVHGGGWQGRSRDDMESIAKRLAARGFVAMNVSYRFAPAWQFPAQLHDLEQAFEWLREAAPRYGVDRERIGAFGYSAGGHLAALLGTMGSGETRLRAVVAGGAPTDLRKIARGPVVPRFLGATLQESPELYAAASPIDHVSADAPPMFLYHGADDWLVDRSHAEDMKRALDAVQVRAEVRMVPFLGHFLTFALARGAEEEAMDFLESALASPARR
jgi:acetyl esterase/lipase